MRKYPGPSRRISPLEGQNSIVQSLVFCVLLDSNTYSTRLSVQVCCIACVRAVDMYICLPLLTLGRGIFFPMFVCLFESVFSLNFSYNFLNEMLHFTFLFQFLFVCLSYCSGLIFPIFSQWKVWMEVKDTLFTKWCMKMSGILAHSQPHTWWPYKSQLW